MIKKQTKVALILLMLIMLITCGSACNSKTKYKIIYDTCGGNKIKSESYDLGEVVNLKIPTKDGSNFIGWYKDNRFEDGPYTKICINKPGKVTFYASWESNEDYAERLIYGKIAEVYNGINSLPTTITYQDIEKVEELNKLYQEIPSEYQNIVRNYETLRKAIEKIPTLKLENLVSEIEKLPFYINYSFSDRVKKLWNNYSELSEELKSQITNYNKLENAYQTITSLEKDVQNPILVWDEYIYNSREELHRAFFTEFYYFVSQNEGVLEKNGITNLDEFLELSLNYDAGRGQMRDFSDRFSQYFLTKDINGVIENQPDTTFIGYCYKNNKFVDVIKFFMLFFSYWRIDEKYATLYNRGADFFSESWAPLVDICKYFYFTAETSPVVTSRVLDCFKNPSGVAIQTSSSSEIPTYKVRGYKVLGWYDNQNFQGAPCQKLDNQFLYAKLELNEDYVGKEQAKFVDIYIYNLTTYSANLSKITVEYVYNMYDELSFSAKRFVTRKSTLETYVERYEIR